MKTLAIYYGFIITSIMLIAGFISSTAYPQLISAALFIPLTLYFLKLVFPKKRHKLVFYEQTLKEEMPIKHKKTNTKDEDIALEGEEVTELPEEKGFDVDRRAFLKLVGSAGISLFVFSLFTKKAHAAFFGSVPGPGTVALKDTSGVQIDPAQNHPTDGYKISQIDDSSPAYYGFTNKDAAWFIMQEDSGGTYRYAKGSSNFPTNWTGRAGLTYDYFHNVF